MRLLRIAPPQCFSAMLGGLLSLSLGAPAMAQKWIGIGPMPMSDGSTGRVTAIDVDPRNPNHWLAGAATGGIWETNDAGLTWTPRTDDQPTMASGAVAFAPGNPKTVYMGTGEVGFSRDAYAGLGLLKSGDGGTTWTLIQAPSLVRASVAALRVHPTDPDTLIVATTRGNAGRYTEPAPSPPEYGVWKSTDGGATWKLTMSGEATALDVDRANFNRQYAAIGNPYRPAAGPVFPSSRDNGVYRSTDGGQTWSPIDGPWTSMAVTTGRIALAVAASNPNTVYASIENPLTENTNGLVQGLLGLFRTDNAWDPTPTWIRVPTQATGPQGYCGRQCSSAHSVTIDPSDPNTVVAGGVDLWRCTKCGSSPNWTNIGGSIHPDHRVLIWRGARLISGNDGGVVSSMDGGDTWQNHNSTLAIGQFFKGDLHPTDPNFAMAGPKDNGCPLIWTGGNVWKAAGGAYHHTDVTNTGDFEGACEGEVAMSSGRPNTDWMTSSGFPLISRTINAGQTAPPAVAGIEEPGAPVTPPVRKCPGNDDRFLTGNLRLWRTDNFFSGSTAAWTSNAPALGAAVLGIAWADSDTTCKTYAYGTAAGQIRLTMDAGKTWADLDPKRILPARGINAIAFDPGNANILYLGFSGFALTTPGKPGHLYKTSDALAAAPVWVDISPPADLPYEVITLDPADPKSVFLGTDAGIWHSSNGGESWQRMGPETGMPNVPVYDIRINRTTQRAVAFTYGRGVFMLNGFGFQPPPAPVTITSVSNGATYLAGLVPGSWAQIQGVNLSKVTRTWGDSDFVGMGNQLPTKLSGVEVKVNGLSAPVYFVSPTQINFQFPSNTLTGPPGNILTSSPVSIQSFLDGVGSNVLATTGTTSSPGIFSNTINGLNYAAAVFLDGKFAGDPSIGPAFRKARPGEVIQLFMTGLIRNQSGIIPGVQVFGGVSVKLGDVLFAADSAALVAVGEFQVNFRAPQQFASLPEGNYPISVQYKLDDGNVTSSPATINSNPPGPVVLPIQH